MLPIGLVIVQVPTPIICNFSHWAIFFFVPLNIKIVILAQWTHLLLQAIFWVIESMIPFGNHPLFLFLLGWMLPPKPAFMKLTTTPVIRAMTFTKQVFQDIVLPINRLEEQINKERATFLPYRLIWQENFRQYFSRCVKIPIVLFQSKYGILHIDAQKCYFRLD